MRLEIPYEWLEKVGILLGVQLGFRLTSENARQLVDNLLEFGDRSDAISETCTMSVLVTHQPRYQKYRRQKRMRCKQLRSTAL